jgi:hypothetical protein
MHRLQTSTQLLRSSALHQRRNYFPLPVFSPCAFGVVWLKKSLASSGINFEMVSKKQQSHA